MRTARMMRALPTTAQAERIHQLFDEAVVEHPELAELFRGFERALIQQPDDSGPGLPVPVEPLVQGMVEGLLEQGAARQLEMLRLLREA